MHKIHVRVPLLRPLPRQLPDHDRIGGFCELTHLLRREIVQRMRRDEQRKIVELQILRCEMTMRKERC
jgi:hypothetical protein